MLTERDIEELSARIVGGSQEAFVAGLTTALIDDLVAGVVNATTRGTLGALAAANRARVDTLLMEHRDAIAETVVSEVRRTLLAADARDADAIAAFRHSSPEGATRHARMMAEQAAVGIRQMVERQNVALARQAEEAWYAVAAEGIRYAEAGALPKGWVDKAVLRLADAGVKTVDYRSGVSNQADVAIKRHMRTQVNQAAGRMEIDRLDACGHRFVQTTAHFGARDEHQGWQGRAFCLDGPADVGGAHYPDFHAATGYGTVTGLCGANCRHHFGAHVPGLSKLPELPEEVNGMGAAEYYEATQRQRELERRVRKTKREVSALEQAGLGYESPTYVQKRLVLGRQQAALRSHCAETGLVRQYARERAYGVGSQPRALSGKAWTVRERGISKKRLALVSAKVDLSRVDTREWKAKFDGLTGNAAADETLRRMARASLVHRDGTAGEDLHLVSIADGEVKASVTSSKEYLGITPTKQVDDAVREHKGLLFSLHNHPSNIPPTGSDFATSGYRGYAGAVAVLHNGEVYYYRHGPRAFSGRGFDAAVEKERRRGYDEIDAFERVLGDYERRFGIEWRRL